MQGIQLLFENSPWWILVCLLAGALYGLLLYTRGKHFKHPSWGKPINYALLVLRAGLVSLLCFLVIGPFIKQIKNTVEPPVVVVAIDNSSSVAAVMDSAQLIALTQRIDSTTTALRKIGYTTEIRDFESLIPLDSLSFTYPSTDLDGALRTIASDYEGRNLASVVLFSDGIYNQGTSPTYRPYRFTINTVGLGDTTAQQDVSVSNVFYNKIAYQGNKFPLVVEVTSNGFAGENLTVSVRRGSVVLDTRAVDPTKQREVSSVEFLLEADREGMQHYVVTVAEQAEEFTTQNNEAHAYVEVIEGKENILLLAQAPHPDIKALRLAIASNQNYQFTSLVLSTDQIAKEQLEGKIDLVIWHQLPGKEPLPKEVQPYLKSANAHWYIVGSQTDLTALNATNNVLEIQNVGGQNDEVSAAYSSDFRGFQLVNDHRTVLEKLLPLRVPFGEVSLKNGAVPILYQQVGKVRTSKPLLAVAETDQGKSAVLLAEGIWKWRQQEYARAGNTEATDALFVKLIQYLSAKEDKRRFKVYPIKNEFQDNEPVVFETELYDEVYEEVYGAPVKLVITAEDSTRFNYNYTTNQNNTQYQVSNLPEGVYQYTAQATTNGSALASKGNFTVRRLQIELLDLTANHTVLRDLAQENGGVYIDAADLSKLSDAVGNQAPGGKIYTSELFLPLINLKWLFFVLLALVAAEWGIRKYMGSY
jgi:hypothetical protein